MAGNQMRMGCGHDAELVGNITHPKKAGRDFIIFGCTDCDLYWLGDLGSELTRTDLIALAVTALVEWEYNLWPILK